MRKFLTSKKIISIDFNHFDSIFLLATLSALQGNFKESKNFGENALYDLEKWDTFEKENPDVFAWMYQFFCQKV